MKILLLTIGTTNQTYLQEGIREYVSRLNHYAKFSMIELPNVKRSRKISHEEIVRKEGRLILNQIRDSDYLIILDNKSSRSYSSIQFSDKLQKWMLIGKKRLIFLIGGAYGFSKEIYNRRNEEFSLSKMTFSHQMVRLVFLEQLYRAYTILNHHPYHHE